MCLHVNDSLIHISWTFLNVVPGALVMKKEPHVQWLSGGLNTGQVNCWIYHVCNGGHLVHNRLSSQLHLTDETYGEEHGRTWNTYITAGLQHVGNRPRSFQVTDDDMHHHTKCTQQRIELSSDFRNTKVRHRLWPLELAHLRGSLRSRMSTTPHTASACWARQAGCTHPTPAGSPWTSLPPHTGPQDGTAQRGTLKRKCKDIKIYRSPHKTIFRK